jgi:hypothetical protein
MRFPGPYKARCNHAIPSVYERHKVACSRRECGRAASVSKPLPVDLQVQKPICTAISTPVISTISLHYPTPPYSPVNTILSLNLQSHDEGSLSTVNRPNPISSSPSLILLPNLRQFPLPPLLHRLRPTLRIQQIIPPPKTTRIIPNKPFMMHIMMIRARPKRQEMMQAPRKLIAAMRVNCLEQSTHDPEIHSQDMQIASYRAPEDRRADGSQAEHHHFDRGGVFGGEAEGRGVLMVDFVDVFVQGAPVHGAVGPVVPCVFHDEEDADLAYHCPDWGERDGGGEAEVLGHWVEEPRCYIRERVVRDW